MLIIRSERNSESMLDKTLSTPNKNKNTTQNDDEIKQTSDAFIDEYTFEEKIHDLSLIHQNIQTGFLSKNKL